MKPTATFLALALALTVPAMSQTAAPIHSKSAVAADRAVPPLQDSRTPVLPKIQKGKRITVVLHKHLGRKIKGSFVGSDADGISVRANNGEVRTVAWESVRSIKPRRTHRGFWIGLATGAAFAGTALLFDDAPAELGFGAAAIAAGAGVGGLAGASIDPYEAPIYEAPHGETESATR